MTHSSDLLDGVAGRIDKVDLLFRCESDLFQQHLASMRDIWDAIEEATGNRIGHRVRCLGVEKESGSRIYGVSTWGIASDDFLNYLPASYYANISRVDFRIETEVTPSQLPALKQHIEEHNPKHRNVQDFTTRGRNKEFARHAGGYGVTFGSHKSDVRLTAYKRRGERGAIEIQISGDSIQRNVLFSQQLSSAEQGPSFYAAVCDGIIARLWDMSREMGFDGVTQLSDFVGVSDYKLTYAENEERKFIEARQAFDSLSPVQQEDFFNLLRVEVKSGFSRLA